MFFVDFKTGSFFAFIHCMRFRLDTAVFMKYCVLKNTKIIKSVNNNLPLGGTAMPAAVWTYL